MEYTKFTNFCDLPVELPVSHVLGHHLRSGSLFLLDDPLRYFARPHSNVYFALDKVATKALYSSLIQVALWKVVWALLATLLWASFLTDMNNVIGIDFVKLICVNLMLGGALISAPWVVNSLIGSGLASFTKDFSGISTGFGKVTPLGAVPKVMKGADVFQRHGGYAKTFATKSGRTVAYPTLFLGSPVENTKYAGRTVMKKTKQVAQKFDRKFLGGNAANNQNTDPGLERTTRWQKFAFKDKKSPTKAVEEKKT